MVPHGRKGASISMLRSFVTVSGYCSSVDAMQSALVGIILFKEFMRRKRGSTLNSEKANFVGNTAIFLMN